jgi:exopolysaccharide production protein ExoZ
MFINIQALRAFAAGVVLLLHAVLLLDPPSLMGAHWLIYPVGISGVDIFFVISGFVIGTIVLSSNLTAPSTWRLAADFLKRRAIRIFPMYWVVFFTVILQNGDFQQPANLTRQAFLIAYSPLLIVTWSLVFEVSFYIIVSIILLFGRRHLNAAICAWAFALVAALWFIDAAPQSIFISPLNFEFLFGVVAALVARRTSNFSILALLVAGLFFAAGMLAFNYRIETGTQIGAYAHLSQYQFERTVTFGVGSMFAVYAAVSLEKRFKFRAPTMCMFLGNASYVLYLVHFPIILIMMPYLMGTQKNASDGSFVIILAMILFISIILRRFLEEPMLRFIKSISTPRSNQTPLQLAK